MAEPIQFADHLANLKWRQGEHIFISGATGSGKTTMARQILDKRDYVIAFSIKKHDPTIAAEYAGWAVVDNMREIEGWMNRVIVWPRLKRGTGEEWKAHQREVLADSFDRLLVAKGWCVFIDELNYLSDPRHGGVRSQIESMHYIGRSSGLSLVSAAQRPAYVPLAVLTNSSHTYIGRTRFASDLKRLADFGDIDPKQTAKDITSLPTRYDFLYQPTQGEGTTGVVNSRR